MYGGGSARVGHTSGSPAVSLREPRPVPVDGRLSLGCLSGRRLVGRLGPLMLCGGSLRSYLTAAAMVGCCSIPA